MRRVRRDLLGNPLDLANGLLGSTDLIGDSLGGLGALDRIGGSGLGSVSGHGSAKDPSTNLVVVPQQANAVPPDSPAVAAIDAVPEDVATTISQVPDLPTTIIGTTTSTDRPTRTVAPAQHAAKEDKCTPSPSKQMPPSASVFSSPFGFIIFSLPFRSLDDMSLRSKRWKSQP